MPSEDELQSKLDAASESAHKRLVIIFGIIVVVVSIVLFASRFTAFNQHPHHDDTTRIGAGGDAPEPPEAIGTVATPGDGSGE